MDADRFEMILAGAFGLLVLFFIVLAITDQMRGL